jgi:hypothetical protein
MFSLKASFATSSVGRTLVVATPYAVKMAFVDAGFRAGLSDEECAALLRALVAVEVRIAPPGHAVVTHTFVKVRQEPKASDPLRPYSATIAYREVVHQRGTWRWAFDLGACEETLARRIEDLTPLVSYIGKRGSFIRFVKTERVATLGAEFTQPLPPGLPLGSVRRVHIMPLDDFGPDADMETLSSFSSGRPVKGRHRMFVETMIPLGLTNTGPGFSEYRGVENSRVESER